jgi:hypothetical protein
MLSSALRAFLGPAPVACPEGQMLTGSCAPPADIIVLITTEKHTRAFHLPNQLCIKIPGTISCY